MSKVFLLFFVPCMFKDIFHFVLITGIFVGIFSIFFIHHWLHPFCSNIANGLCPKAWHQNLIFFLLFAELYLLMKKTWKALKIENSTVILWNFAKFEILELLCLKICTIFLFRCQILVDFGTLALKFERIGRGILNIDTFDPLLMVKV